MPIFGRFYRSKNPQTGICVCLPYFKRLQFRGGVLVPPKQDSFRLLNRHVCKHFRCIVEVKVNARDGELTDAVKETIESKVSKLPRFFERTTAIQVIADLKHDEPKVEIILSAEGASDFFASDSGTNVISALDTTIAKMEQQLRKHKEKITAHRDRHGSGQPG